MFDAAAFRISPSEASVLDPQQRMMLEVRSLTIALVNTVTNMSSGSGEPVQAIILVCHQAPSWSQTAELQSCREPGESCSTGVLKGVT